MMNTVPEIYRGCIFFGIFVKNILSITKRYAILVTKHSSYILLFNSAEDGPGGSFNQKFMLLFPL